LGLAVTSIFGIVYALAYSRLPGSSPLVKSVVLGLSAYIAIFMLPFLKYPSNPPGVGSSDTIFFRQSLYVGFQIISIIGVALAYLVYNHLVTKKGSKYSTSLLAIITYLTIISIAFALMPPNPDPLIVPLDLLLDFRVLSLLGQTVMWLIIAFTYGKTWWLLVRTSSSPISLAKAADGPS
ncbi:MAG: CbtA family protein, partial [Thaumarchaeota archaeon]|nr:CbtA family protein [Nitrososphaerota archaeon]